MRRFSPHPACHAGRPRRQQGAVLAISLIILLIVTLLGVTAMQSTTLEEKMAGNARDRNTAFQAAESTLRIAEAWIPTKPVSDFNDSNGLYSEFSTTVPTTDQLGTLTTWTASGATRQLTGADAVPGVATQPRYFIQYIGEVSDGGNTSLNIGPGYGGMSAGASSSLFRVTVRATGGSDNAVVVLRTLYGHVYFH